MAQSLENLLPLLAELNRQRDAAAPLADIAEMLGLSVWHAQRVFQSHVGESPKRYRRRLRLEAAAVLLATTDETVLDIALAVGFDSHEGFTRAFRSKFGRAPRAYRDQQRAANATLDPESVRRIGPCVGLFRAELGARTQPHARNLTMSHYDITRQSVDAIPVVFMRKRLEHDRIAEGLGEVLPVVFAFAMEKGMAIAGHPFTRYSDWSAGFVTIEAGVPLSAAPAAFDHDTIEAGELPAGPAAVTVHTGPYEKLGEAHKAVETWIADGGHKTGGDAYELYLTDPGEVPDPADWKTKIVWPLAD